VQIINALEVLLHLRVVEPYYLCKFLASLVHLTALEVNLQLPSPLIEPDLKRALTLCLEETLSFSEVFFSEQQLQV
jgi:hypothetical protein